MNELIINDRRVDLGENTNIGLTFCANNIGELQNRQGNFSNTFKLPITKTNREIFEWSHLQTSASLMPYKKLKATYKQNGIEIINDGVVEIQSTDDNYFYINVYSGNIDFSDAIKDLSVGDLYLNDQVNWSFWPIVNASTNQFYSFPLIDWRKDIDTFFATANVDVRQLLPVLKVKDIFSRLSSKIGYTFSGAYLNSSDHLNMVLTPNEFSVPKTEEVKTSQPLTSTLSTYTSIPSGSATSYVDYYPNFRNENNNPDFAIGVFKPTINKIGKLKFAGDYDLFFSGTLGGPGGIVAKQVIVNAYITDVTGTIPIYGPIVYGPNVYGLTRLVIDIETPEMTFLANTEYKVKLRIEVPQTNKNQIVNLTDYQTKTTFLGYIGGVDSQSPSIVLPHYLQFSPSPKIAFNTNLNFKDLFTMKVSDVFKDIVNLRAIILQTDNYTKNISFNTFEDINLNKAISNDWSNKIQPNKSMSFKFGNYAKKNNFLFKSDNDKTFNADTKNDYYFNLNDENLEAEKPVVKLSHPSTILQNRYQGYITPCINGLIDGTNEWNNSDWRLLNLKVQNTPFIISHTDGANTVPKNTFVPFCDMVGFETLVPKYYSTLQGILDRTKMIKITAKLDVTDISNLNFTIPIYIQRPDLNLNGFFYINKIENYKGGLTSCEIIEI